MRPATHARHHEAVDGSGLDERGRPVVFEVTPAPPAPTHRLRTVGGIVAVVLVGAAVLGGTIALAAPAGPAGGSEAPPPLWYIPPAPTTPTATSADPTLSPTTISTSSDDHGGDDQTSDDHSGDDLSGPDRTAPATADPAPPASTAPTADDHPSNGDDSSPGTGGHGADDGGSGSGSGGGRGGSGSGSSGSGSGSGHGSDD